MLGASPADRTKVAAPAKDAADPADQYFDA